MSLWNKRTENTEAFEEAEEVTLEKSKSGNPMLGFDENGDVLKFNSMVDAMNYMGALGWEFEVEVSQVEERITKTHPGEIVEALSLLKAQDVFVLKAAVQTYPPW